MVDAAQLTSIEDLRSAPYNPRSISIEAAAGLAQSMGDFGDLSGIVWNQRSGNLVCGHQRVQELRRMGVKLVDGALQLPSGDQFPVRVVDWEEIKEKTANVVANNPGIAGVFTDKVGPLLAEIAAGIGDAKVSLLQLDGLRDGEEPEAAKLKEWDASEISLDGMFIFHAPIEMQAKIRAVLEREFRDVKFREEVVYGCPSPGSQL